MKPRTSMSAVGSGLRPRQQGKNKFRDSVMNVLWVGQTNAGLMFTGFSGAGNTAFRGIIDDYYPTVNSINGSTSGAAIHKDADNGGGYYWDVSGNAPGAALTAALTAIDSAGVARKNIDVVVIVHGERDATAINAGTITAAQSKAALLAYINYLRTQLGNPVVILVPLGAERTSANHTSWGLLRRAQWELWNENSYILEGPGYWDLTYDNNINLTQAGYEAFAGRVARRILAIFGKISAVGTMGPRIASCTFSPTADRAYVTIAHDGGTDFTMTERRGNGVSQNGAAPVNVPTSITKIDATSYQINPVLNFLSGDNVTVSWPWGTMQSHTPANCLRDNATNAMPLRPSFDVNCTQIA